MQDRLKHELQALLGDRFRSVRLDPVGYDAFRARYHDPRPGIDAAKVLEYYISYTYLNLRADDHFVDVAAQNCPYSSFLRETIGCQAYRLDLYYLERARYNEHIGGDGIALPFAGGALNKIALHNSFEHFEGDADILFMQECERVLAPGGVLCIVPLFIDEQYSIETEAGWVDEEGEKHLWNIGAQFSRQYDVQQFKTRVLDPAPGLEVSLYQVENISELDAGIYMQTFAMFQRKPGDHWQAQRPFWAR